MKRQKICVITGTRAEFGLLKKLMTRLRDDRHFELQVIATGTHMSRHHGYTLKEIYRAGFRVQAKVPILRRGNTPYDVAQISAKAQARIADALKKLKPDLVIVLGDRYEILAAATVAYLMGIPIAHLHGGERTDGALDDCIRHAASKLSSLHFVSHAVHRKRLLQLGEDPRRVFNVGAFSVENIRNEALYSKKELLEKLGLNRKAQGKKLIVVGFHSETQFPEFTEPSFRNLLAALDRLPDTFMLFTAPNADAGSEIVRRLIEKYVAQHPEKTIFVPSLGIEAYLSCLKHFDAIVGNSSSGIIEAPYFKIPSLSVGHRQQGREAPASVLFCKADTASLERGLRKALSAAFKKICATTPMVYGRGDSSLKTLRQLKKLGDFGAIKHKYFVDLDCS